MWRCGISRIGDGSSPYMCGKYFNRLKIGGKLTIGFGILGALTMLVIGLSYLGSYRATRNINRTADVRVPTALASARAQANLLRMQAAVQAYLALGDQAYRSSFHQAQQAFEVDLALLGDLANFQASFFAMVAGLRGYVTTGRDSFQFEYTSNLTVNNSAWEQLVKNQAQLESNQRDTLRNISQTRAAFLALPPQMFEAVRGEHAREDLFLFRTQAVPLAETTLQLLDELTAAEQQLLQADLTEGREQLAIAQWQTAVSGTAALLLGLGLAFIFRENIAGPIRRLTAVAERIGAGDLAAQAPVESGDEIGTL